MLLQIVAEKKINPQLFWRTREFASRGSFIYEHNGFNPAKTAELQNKFNLKKEASSYLFLEYESANWQSVEGLVDKETVAEMTNVSVQKDKRIIWKKDTELIYYESPNKIRMIFVKPVSEMKTANGFLDYAGNDKDLVKNKHWLSISSIVL